MLAIFYVYILWKYTIKLFWNLRYTYLIYIFYRYLHKNVRKTFPKVLYYVNNNFTTVFDLLVLATGHSTKS